jgi:hypothetical protein
MSQVPQNQGTSEIQGKPGNILCFAVVPKDSGAPELRSKKKGKKKLKLGLSTCQEMNIGV